MPIVRRTPAEIDKAALLRNLAAARVYTEEEIEAHAVEDGGALTDAELALMVVVYPPLKPNEINGLRIRLGLTLWQFARRFGFAIDTLQQYEDGRQIPSGPASILLRVIAAEPEAVERALQPVRQSEVALP